MVSTGPDVPTLIDLISFPIDSGFTETRATVPDENPTIMKSSPYQSKVTTF